MTDMACHGFPRRTTRAASRFATRTRRLDQSSTFRHPLSRTVEYSWTRASLGFVGAGSARRRLKSELGPPLRRDGRPARCACGLCRSVQRNDFDRRLDRGRRRDGRDHRAVADDARADDAGQTPQREASHDDAVVERHAACMSTAARPAAPLDDHVERVHRGAALAQDLDHVPARSTRRHRPAGARSRKSRSRRASRSRSGRGVDWMVCPACVPSAVNRPASLSQETETVLMRGAAIGGRRAIRR